VTRRPELDPTGEHHGGLPTYPWRSAPYGFMTRRQLTEAGLRAGGQPIAAQVVRGRYLHAYLYRRDLALPKRTASPAWLASTRKATAARRWCASCETTKDYIPSKRLGECNECADGRSLVRVAA
jgi:hypothetical protein